MKIEKSIRNYCLECTNESSKEVKLCPSDDCPLYKSRMGNRGSKKEIVAKCRECSEKVSECEFELCPLYTYTHKAL